MNKKTPEIQNRSEKALKILDSLLNEPGRKKINESQIIVILDALASAEDAEVVARFPAVLAICARRGLVLNSQALFARYWETSPKRQNLEKLLLVSAAIFKAKGLTPPGNLNQIAASLKHKYGDLLPAGQIQMSSGMHVSVPTLENTLDSYMAGAVSYPARRESKRHRQPGSLDALLDRLFSPKQKELVLKKRDGKTFTKTEREYYSRTVRKKLEAIASEELAKLAQRLTTK